MTQDTVAYCIPKPWYRREPFYLLPDWGYRPANEHNCSDWHFAWLSLQVWSAMSPSVSVSAALTFDPGPHVQINALYHHVRLTLPVPWKLRAWTQRHLWRRGTRKW